MKKTIITIILLSLVFIVILAVYQYFVINNKSQGINEDKKMEAIEEQNNSSNSSLEDIDNVNTDIKAQGFEAEGTNGGGTLTVCLDKCGDGVCQNTDLNCKDGLNCICSESVSDCSKDCN